MSQVFLAHSSAQRELTNRLEAKLSARGFRVFYSDRTIPAGENFDALIRSAIGRSQFMVFVVSDESVTQGSYALTELKLASERWPNPRDRVLAVTAGDVDLKRWPAYLRDNVEVLRPQGDLPTETAAALVAMRNRRRRRHSSLIVSIFVVFCALVAATIWRMRLAEAARIDHITSNLLEAGKRARLYTNTCVRELARFRDYDHTFRPADGPCDPSRTLNDLEPPALVVAQTGYGKGGFLSSVQGTLAQRGRPSIFINYRECRRLMHSGSVDIDLTLCIRDKLMKVTGASQEDAALWLNDPSRYVLIFDAIDDQGSRESVFKLVELLWRHQQNRGAVIFSSHADTLNYVMLRYSLEEFMHWLRDDVPTVDVRGINRHSVVSVASRYEEHRASVADIETLVNFGARCAEADGTIEEFIAAPKIFRDRGAKSLPPVVAAIRALPNACTGWRRTVLGAMLQARFWSYCHDELCNGETDGPRFVAATRKLQAFAGAPVSEAELEVIAKAERFRDLDQLAFGLLSAGVLFVDKGRLQVDPRWVPAQ